jgi:hypothetical protein
MYGQPRETYLRDSDSALLRPSRRDCHDDFCLKTVNSAIGFLGSKDLHDIIVQRSEKERNRAFRCLVGCFQLLAYQNRPRVCATRCNRIEDESEVRELRIDSVIHAFRTIGRASHPYSFFDAPSERYFGVC